MTMRNLMKVLLLISAALLGSPQQFYAQALFEESGIRKLDVQGFAQGPELSPDGKHLAFSRENYDQVFVIRLETNTISRLCTHLGAGWGMEWLDARHMIVRSTKQGLTARDRSMGMELIDVEAKKESVVIPFRKSNRLQVPRRVMAGKAVIRNNASVQVFEVLLNRSVVRGLKKNEELLSFHESTIVAGTRSISTPGRRQILSLVVAPGGSKSLVELMGQPSLYLFLTATHEFRLVSEKGEHPAWVDDSLFVYMETMDDGYKVVGGDVYLASVNNEGKQNLTESFSGIALHPTASSDGKISFNTPDGEIYLLQIRIP